MEEMLRVGRATGTARKKNAMDGKGGKQDGRVRALWWNENLVMKGSTGREEGVIVRDDLRTRR